MHTNITNSTPSSSPPYQGGERVGVEYENDDLLVVNKPAGIPVYSTKKHQTEESVLSWFLSKYPSARSIGDAERPGVIHRLDKQTSGLLVLAKTQAIFDYLKNLFARRKISKEYLALVYGSLPKHGVIEKPLAKIGYHGSGRVRVDEEGKKAITEYWTKGYYSRELDQFSLVRVKLHTGRTHQIRVHFAHQRHPVMGDDLYGKPDSQKLKDILPRQFLHASRLEFQLPDRTYLEVESELPEELRQVLHHLKIQQ